MYTVGKKNTKGAKKKQKPKSLPYLKWDRLDDIVSDEFKVRLTNQVRDIRLISREEVVKAYDGISPCNKEVAEVRSDETRTTCNKNTVRGRCTWFRTNFRS